MPDQLHYRGDRRGFCPGCGYYHAVHNAHRADCTARTPQEAPTDA